MKYQDLSYAQQTKICKDTLRPIAGTIFGHLYEAEVASGNLHVLEQMKTLAERSVLAASQICGVLNKYYGDQADDEYSTTTSRKIFTVTYAYGQEVYSANSKEELFEYLNNTEWIGEKPTLNDIEEVELTTDKIQFIGGHVE